MRASDNRRVNPNRRGWVAFRGPYACPMIERCLLLMIAAVAVWCAWDGASLHAQSRPSGPDVRGYNPLMMLVVDTSGSMEYKTECECVSRSCSECYPICDRNSGTYEKNRWAITLEALTGGWVGGYTCQSFPRNDSGVFDYDFGYVVPYHQPWQCPLGVSIPCNDPQYRQQMENGILDVYRSRVRFGMMTFDSEETYSGASSNMVTEGDFVNSISQSAAGLYSYGPDQPILTYVDGQPLTDALGNWVYSTSSDRYRGPNAPDRYVGHLSFPNCNNPYRIDTGVRRAPQEGETIVGGLISPLEPNTERETINTRIQESLLGARPYMGTPIAGSLDDLYFYLKGDSDIGGDALFACRGRYALLITDGEPDPDFRENTNCDCESAEACCNVATNYNPSCSDPNNPTFKNAYDPDVKGYQCPYPTAEEVAEALICGYDTTSCGGGVLEQLFVVGFALPNCQKVDGELVCEPGSQGEQIYNRLQAIAEAGSPDGEGKALFADNLDELSVTLAQVLDNIADQPISRTTPTFAGSSQGSGLDFVQYQFSTGFIVGSVEQGVPWSGKLERKRIQAADTTQGYVEHDLESQDRFHEVLNDRSAPRKLYTVLPKVGSECPDAIDASSECTLNDHLYRGATNAPCGDIDCEWGSTCDCEIDSDSECGPNATDPPNFANCPLTAAQLGAAPDDNTRRAQLIRWLHGVAEVGDPDFVQQRTNHRLGDIVFSSPAVMGSPDFARDDDSYNQFRQASIVAHRPLVVYVGSNDGILHAFSVEDYPGAGVEPPAPYELTSLSTGEEIWGFIPPKIAQFVNSRANEWKPMVDGTPVVKDVFLSRKPGQGLCLDPDKTPSAPDDDGLCNYRTILILGLRGGGRAYIALDVTNPTVPRFLWQFAHPDLGLTYGKAGLGQVVIEWPPGQTDRVLMERAIAILPGGKNPYGPDKDTPVCPSFKKPGGMNQVFQTRSEPESTVTMHDHRENVRCWEPEVDIQGSHDLGRSVFVVDVKTGILIKQIDSSIFPSPVIGSPSLFHGEVGTIATRAFVADADGVIWRIDLSDVDPQADSQLEGWTARPFHDMYWAHTSSNGYPNGYADGEPGFEPPLLSVDEKGRVVVIFGTGDVDDFEDTDARNYVVSLTETNVYESGTDVNPDEIQAAFNWEIARGSTSGGSSRGMGLSELVTGPIELFDGKVFFSSFQPAPNPDDACAWGRSHLFAVDYIKRDPNITNPLHSPATYYPLELTPEQLGSDAENFNKYHDEQLFMGVAVVKRPQFHTVETDMDPYAELGGLVDTIETTPPVFELVSMASRGAQTGGSDLGTSSSRIAPPVAVSRTLSMSTSCE